MSTVGATLFGAALWSLDQPQPPLNHYSDLAAPPSSSTDITASYETLCDQGLLNRERVATAFETVAPCLSGHLIAFVPPLLSDVWNPVNRFRLGEYLTPSCNATTCVAPVDSGAGVAANAARLIEFLAAAREPIWLITQSKGGVDVLDALVRRPDLVTRVAGWIALQAPFFGSPIADMASGGERAGKIVKGLAQLFSGDAAAVADLRTDVRRAYMASHAAAIRELARRINILAVTMAPAPEGSLLSKIAPAIPTIPWMEGLGLENDGLVPVNAAILPGARYVKARGLIHGEPTLRPFVWSNADDSAIAIRAYFALALGAQPNAGRA